MEYKYKIMHYGHTGVYSNNYIYWYVIRTEAQHISKKRLFYIDICLVNIGVLKCNLYAINTWNSPTFSNWDRNEHHLLSNKYHNTIQKLHLVSCIHILTEPGHPTSRLWPKTSRAEIMEEPLLFTWLMAALTNHKSRARALWPDWLNTTLT